jgi:hypothetical protein
LQHIVEAGIGTHLDDDQALSHASYPIPFFLKVVDLVQEAMDDVAVRHEQGARMPRLIQLIL